MYGLEIDLLLKGSLRISKYKTEKACSIFRYDVQNALKVVKKKRLSCKWKLHEKYLGYN